jgi:PAS domain S-box-containing protein
LAPDTSRPLGAVGLDLAERCGSRIRHENWKNDSATFGWNSASIRLGDPASAAEARNLQPPAGFESRTDGPAPGALDSALLGGPPQRVGTFEYRYDTDTWTWSDTVAKMHGYEPDEVQPTTELVLSHKHPDDLAHVKALLKQSSAPFSSRHRIRTTTGETRRVVVVGVAVTDPSGRTVATRGFYVDITEAFHADLQQGVGDELQVIVAHREVIEQAKGMLMAVYAVSAEAAFSILKWRSQELNVKLHDVAAKLVADLPSLLQSNLTARTPVDHYLMTLTADDI